MYRKFCAFVVHEYGTMKCNCVWKSVSLVQGRAIVKSGSFADCDNAKKIIEVSSAISLVMVSVD
jgi:hypothetical protein